MQVNLSDAKIHLASYVKKLEAREEDEIIITRNGTPVAKLERIVPQVSHARIGVASGKFGVASIFFINRATKKTSLFQFGNK